jgi:hypothetical protein
MNARVVSVHPWGYRSIVISTGRKFDLTKAQIDFYVKQGRIKPGRLYKGKTFTILPSPE